MSLEEKARRIAETPRPFEFRRLRTPPPSPTPPGSEIAAATPSRTRHQVGLKLTLEKYERLRSAARLDGLTPTTLARAFVTRGVHAVLENQ